jgi:hypothetical protein
LFGDAEECEKCEAPVKWPEAIRLLVCMDNLLWLFERRIEVHSADAFADFVCVLVSMTNNLLRKQEVPSIREREWSLQLLADMGVVCDLNKGIVISTKNPNDLQIYLVKDSLREGWETFGPFFFREFRFFAAKMADGVRL